MHTAAASLRVSTCRIPACWKATQSELSRPLIRKKWSTPSALSSAAVTAATVHLGAAIAGAAVGAGGVAVGLPPAIDSGAVVEGISVPRAAFVRVPLIGGAEVIRWVSLALGARLARKVPGQSRTLRPT